MLETMTPYTGKLALKGDYPGVYVIHHPSSGKRYIGSSTNPARRENQHRNMLKNTGHRNPYLQAAYDIDPDIHFVYYLTSDREAAYALEQVLIDYYMPLGVLFNTGMDVKKSFLNRKHSDETKQLISAHRAGVPISDAHKAAISAATKGVPKTDEHRRKISEAHLQREYTEEHIQRFAELGRSSRKKVSGEGVVYASITEAARLLNTDRSAIHYRLRNHRRPDWHYL